MRKITYITSTFVALMALQAHPVNADNINKVPTNQLTFPLRSSRKRNTEHYKEVNEQTSGMDV